MGIAFYPENGMDIATLLKSADTAMYMAKAAGKNTFGIFSPELDKLAKKKVIFKM
jgi:GGDEF domain-containing protein